LQESGKAPATLPGRYLNNLPEREPLAGGEFLAELCFKDALRGYILPE